MPDLSGYYCVTANEMARERRAKLRKLARFSHVRQSVIERIMGNACAGSDVIDGVVG
jgi:IS30 family transposase